MAATTKSRSTKQGTRHGAKAYRREAPSGDSKRSGSDGLNDLQRTVGNRAVGAMLQRDAAPVTTPAPAPAEKAPTGTEPAGKTYVIWDRFAKREVTVDEATARQTFEELKRGIRALAKAIPEDAARVLEEYPYEKPKEMYAACIDALQSAARALARGDLNNAGVWYSAATKFSDIEIQAHKIFQQESVWSYVGKRVGLGVIGFFQGAADTVLGIVDSAAGLVGADTGLVKWNEKQYDKIKTAYGGAAGIEHQYVHDDEIGRFGGKVAGGLATGKALQGAGTAGHVVMGVQAVAGVKGAVDTIMDLRSKGKSWSDIATDPIALSQVAGAIAGVAGMGSIASGELKSVFDQVGLYASGAQFAALTGAIVAIELDPSLSGDAKFQKRLDLLADAIVVAGSTADTVHGQSFESGGSRGGGGEGNGGGKGGSGEGGIPGPNDGVPRHVGPEGDAHLSPDVSTGVPKHVGPEGDAHVEPLAVKPRDESFPRPVEGEQAGSRADQPDRVGVEDDAVLSVAPAPRAEGAETVGPDLDALRQQTVEALGRYEEANTKYLENPADPTELFNTRQEFDRAYAEWLSAHGYKPYQQIKPKGASDSFPETAPPVVPEATRVTPDPRAADRVAAHDAANTLLDQLRAVQEGRRAAPEDPILRAEEQRLLGEFYGAYADLVRANGIDPTSSRNPGETLTPQ